VRASRSLRRARQRQNGAELGGLRRALRRRA
jgi:hypothetical protein